MAPACYLLRVDVIIGRNYPITHFPRQKWERYFDVWVIRRPCSDGSVIVRYEELRYAASRVVFCHSDSPVKLLLG